MATRLTPSSDTPAALPASRPYAAWRRRPAFWGLVVLLGGTLAIVGLTRRGPLVETAAVVRTDIEQHVVSSGRVRVSTRVQLAAQVAGRITAVPATEGRIVASGDVLVQLDDREQRAAVAQARAAVDQARSRLEQLDRVGAVVASETSREAATALDQAEADLARVTTLAKAGAVSQADLEDARRTVEVARARKRAADARSAAAEPDGADRQLAEAALVESQARLAAAEARLEDTVVVAPHAGTVLTKLIEPGDTVQPGTLLLELAASGVTELIIEPDERNLAWIRLGQVARVSADAFPDTVFDGVVSYIAPAVDARRGSIEVRLEVASPPPFLRPDMTVSVDLTVASRADAVVVPSAAVRDQVTAAPFVWVVEEDRLTRRNVTLGIRGSGHTEVTAGVEPGDTVVVAAPGSLEEQQRVRSTQADH